MPNPSSFAPLAATLPLAFALSGCINTENAARTRAANEFGCPRHEVVITPRADLSKDTYDVYACGTSARYTCTPRGRSHSVNCAREPDPKADGTP